MLIKYIPYLFMFLQLLAGETVFLIRTPRRSLFALRYSVSAVLTSVGAYFLVFMPNIGFWIYMIPFAMGCALAYVCWDINPFHAIVFAVIAYSLQNCAFDMAYLLASLSGNTDIVVVEWLELAFLAVLLVACLFLFVRRGMITDVLGTKNIQLVVVCVVALSAVTVLHTYFNSDTAETIGRVFLILCNMLSLFLLFGISGRESLAREKEEMARMLRREETLHRLSRESIELINMKCHDLKHTLLTGRGALPEDAAKEIESAIARYDAFVKTGNPDLDIVIAEKSLRCSKSGITLSCMADGAALSFVSPVDIYALFGNALDNAIEALEHSDPDKRDIVLTVRACDGMVSVCVENYCAVAPDMSEGLPLTSKGDKNSHGFGMKSMRYIAEKYGGRLVADVRDSKFVLAVIFPSRSAARPSPGE